MPTSGSEPSSITVGPDGNMWFTEAAADKIGNITLSGVFSEYSISVFGAVPIAITTGVDNTLWFTRSGDNKIGRITGIIIGTPTAPVTPADPTTPNTQTPSATNIKAPNTGVGRTLSYAYHIPAILIVIGLAAGFTALYKCRTSK